MKALTGIVVLALAGCSTPSDVVKTGPDAYRVRPDAGPGASRRDADIKEYGTKRAYEYCDAEGKHAVITITQSTDWHLFRMPSAEVRFVCEDQPRRSPAKGSTT